MIEVAAGPWTQQQTEGQGTRDPPAPRGAGAFTQSPAGQDGQMEVMGERVSRWCLYESPSKPWAEWLASCPVPITGAGPSALPSPPTT